MNPEQEHSIRQLIAEHLGVDLADVTDTAYLSEDLGADSLDTADIIRTLEDEHKIVISNEALRSIRTVQDLLNAINTQDT